MRITLGRATPDVHVEAWVSPTAVLAGDVTVAREASVWFGSVLRADGDAISIGEGSNIQDAVVVHADPGFPVTVAPSVSVGHGAVLHGCSIGEGALIGMRAAVLNGAKIGPLCLVAAGSVVLEGEEFEARSLIAGVPAKRRRGLTSDECSSLLENAKDYRGLTTRYRAATPG